MFARIDFKKAAIAGVAGTAAMTALMLMAPAMGLPPMNIGKMLGGVMAGSIALGWIAHFMIGTILAIGYALVSARLPGPTAARGALFGVAPWLVAQLMVMPMMGAGLFSGSALVAGASLMGHLLYGVVVGVVYGRCDACAPSPHAHAHG